MLGNARLSLSHLQVRAKHQLSEAADFRKGMISGVPEPC